LYLWTTAFVYPFRLVIMIFLFFLLIIRCFLVFVYFSCTLGHLTLLMIFRLLIKKKVYPWLHTYTFMYVIYMIGSVYTISWSYKGSQIIQMCVSFRHKYFLKHSNSLKEFLDGMISTWLLSRLGFDSLMSNHA